MNKGALRGQHAADVPTKLLAVTEYDPVSTTTYTLNTTSLTAIDPTNLTITFVAPANGRVLVRLTGMLGGSGTAFPQWGLIDANGNVPRGARYQGSQVSGGGGFAAYAVPIPVSGLTPGQTYTFKWAAQVVTGSTSQNAGGGTGTGFGNVAVMEVWGW